MPAMTNSKGLHWQQHSQGPGVGSVRGTGETRVRDRGLRPGPYLPLALSRNPAIRIIEVGVGGEARIRVPARQRGERSSLWRRLTAGLARAV